MRIGQLGKAAGVEVETIRYYEKAGLLPAPARGDNGYRAFAAAHLERLEFIRHCRALDLPLAEIRRLLDFVDRPAAECKDVDGLIDEQLRRVRRRIEGLHALERQLTALRGCCTAPQTAADCGILRRLVGAQPMMVTKQKRNRTNARD